VLVKAKNRDGKGQGIVLKVCEWSGLVQPLAGKGQSKPVDNMDNFAAWSSISGIKILVKANARRNDSETIHNGKRES